MAARMRKGGRARAEGRRNVISDDGRLQQARRRVRVLQEPSELWCWQRANGRDVVRFTSHGNTSDPTRSAVLLVHGFGANCEHWRHNIDSLVSSGLRVYCIDLLGYGWSDKPVAVEPVVLYNMNTWAQQLNDFIDDVVQSPVFFGCNSIGGIVALQAAVKRLDLARGAFLLDLSVRGLHVKNQTPLQRPFVSAFQWTLWNSPIGDFFFKSVAQPNAVANVLKEAYYNSSHVTDELVEALLQPGLLPNASRVFLDFLCYSGGPLPGELLEEVSCPVSMVWGVDDPWEEISKGRGFKHFPNVEEFIEIAQCGHCPQDEQPEIVNDYLIHFIERHAGNQKPVAA